MEAEKIAGKLWGWNRAHISIGEQAIEIAKLCEEEVTLVKREMALAMTEMSAYSSKEFAAYDARLAVMTEALETIQALSGTDVMIHSSMQAAKMVAKQALSAAPKARVRQKWLTNESKAWEADDD